MAHNDVVGSTGIGPASGIQELDMSLALIDYLDSPL